ncbi:MAG: dihydrodipicolinate synthase family protein [Solirubrobacterales bacterium]
MAKEGRIEGIVPAALTPFHEGDGSIHEADLERHFEYLLGTPGVTGIAVNGHAGEVSSLTRDEQALVLEVARRAVDDSQWLIAGVYAHSSAEARECAVAATEAGADALLIFPPEIWEFGLADDPRLAYGYYEEIARASELPLIAFVYPHWSPVHLSADVVLELCHRVPSIAAVKDWSNDLVAYERTLRNLRAEHPGVSMLSSYSRGLAASLAVGADGILSGHGSLIPELQARLFAQATDGDLEGMRETAAVLFELTQVFYAAPIADGFTRMKHAAVALGRLSSGRVRPPLLPLSAEAAARVERVLPLLSERAAHA